jgi:hypothetical protein
MFKELEIKRGLLEIEPLLNYLKDKSAFICGGYARYCLSPVKKPVKAVDVDIYCKNEETYLLLKEHFKEVGLEIRFENQMAITYKLQKEVYQGCPTIQLIKPMDVGAVLTQGTPEEILENFDFTVVRCAIISDENGIRAIADEDFEKDESTKFLRIKKIHCPISSLLRFMKYGKKGYFTRPVQLIRLFNDWDSRSDDYRNKIVETLTKIENNEGHLLTQEDINELEKLMRID